VTAWWQRRSKRHVDPQLKVAVDEEIAFHLDARIQELVAAEPVRTGVFEMYVSSSICPTRKWATSAREMKPIRQDLGSTRI
jgi:hypothetical protein